VWVVERRGGAIWWWGQWAGVGCIAVVAGAICRQQTAELLQAKSSEPLAMDCSCDQERCAHQSATSQHQHQSHYTLHTHPQRTFHASSAAVPSPARNMARASLLIMVGSWWGGGGGGVERASVGGSVGRLGGDSGSIADTILPCFWFQSCNSQTPTPNPKPPRPLPVA